METIKKFFADETGLELTEYAIAAGIIAVGLVVLFSNIGTLIKTKVNTIYTELSGS